MTGRLVSLLENEELKKTSFLFFVFYKLDLGQHFSGSLTFLGFFDMFHINGTCFTKKNTKNKRDTGFSKDRSLS